MLRTRYVGLLVPALVVLVGHSAAQEKKDPKPGAGKQTPHPRLKTVRELGTPSFTDTFTVYYSTGHEKRAKEYGSLLKEMARFYEEKLKIKAEFSVAVLTRDDWQRVEKAAPYGIPSVSSTPRVILLPATNDGLVAIGLKARRDKASAETLKKIERAGFTYEQGAEKFVELIARHELGHVLTPAYGIGFPCRWLDEFLATYFSYAFLCEAHPKLATLQQAMSYDLQVRDSEKPKFIALDDFDRLYFKFEPANYAWYMSAFSGRVAQVYDAKKFDFLDGVRKAFPLGTEEGQPARVVLERLERVCPGFVAWAEGLK